MPYNERSPMRHVSSCGIRAHHHPLSGLCYRGNRPISSTTSSEKSTGSIETKVRVGPISGRSPKEMFKVSGSATTGVPGMNFGDLL